MILDPLSVILALSLSIFCFVIQLLFVKKLQFDAIKKKLRPAADEIEHTLMRNFLAFDSIPSKSKLISVISATASKYDIGLFSHLPIHEIIDRLVLAVISNDLVPNHKKKQLSDELIKLKGEPIASEDFIHLVAEGEKADLIEQKNLYNQLTASLAVFFAATVILGVLLSQYSRYLHKELLYLADFSFVFLLGLTLSTMVFSSLQVFRNTLLPTSQGQQEETEYQKRKLPRLSPISSFLSNLGTTQFPAMTELKDRVQEEQQFKPQFMQLKTTSRESLSKE